MGYTVPDQHLDRFGEWMIEARVHPAQRRIEHTRIA
jgi:hypothetical protein